jgi:hypothetical protein
MNNPDPPGKPADDKWPLWLTKHQAAARLGKSVAEIVKLHERGYLHPVLKHGVRLFALGEVEELARPGRRLSPWFASPSIKSRRAKIPEPHAPGKGQEAAHVFRMLDRGMDLREIVTRARIAPHRVRQLHRQWARSLAEGPPPTDNALGDGADLDALAVAAEELFAKN